MMARVTFDAQARAASRSTGLDDVEAAEMLLGLHERAVRGQHRAVGHAHDGGGVGLVQAAGEDPGAARLERLDRIGANP